MSAAASRATALLLAAAVASGCATRSGGPAAVPPRANAPAANASTAAGADWVEQTLASLSLEEKAGQVLMPVIRVHHANLASAEARRLESLVRELGAGGFIVSRGDPLETVETLNRLQRAAKVPLLIAADFEWGTGVHILHGGTFMPYAMAIGATGDEELARTHARATAREARALGIHMAFAPVADVNNNPDNPIIALRSFGEDPAEVARLAAAWTRGAREAGLLTTAKHFPGHGDTGLDSHLVLATIAADRARLDAVELPPFRAQVAAGVEAVMIGHLAVPALDPSGLPATLSAPIMGGVLRGELGFRGLVVSDAMDMGGVTGGFAPGEAAVRSLAAGNDVVLMSPAPEEAKAAIVAAVKEGRLPQARLDDAVRRLLETKRLAGLDRTRESDPARVWTDVAHPDDLARMQELADRSLTLVKDDAGALPLAPGPGLVHVTLAGDPLYERLDASFESEVRRRAPETTSFTVEPRTGAEDRARVLAAAREARVVVVSAFARVRAFKGSAALPEDLSAFLQELCASGRPVVVVSYASPYLLLQAPAAPTYVAAYGHSGFAIRAVGKALFGEIPFRGRLPVTLPGLFARGHGLAK
ncbi:MAG: glycoside hydrolase family 3 C-terminal domain-containing protein [Vicinamibacteria bacterium]|nr:glycoside hydrolase family 3 C-terminal domain-containing protein [Vicinamibacteria bacterium]